jgi:CRP-like cAMP-binding protein
VTVRQLPDASETGSPDTEDPVLAEVLGRVDFLQGLPPVALARCAEQLPIVDARRGKPLYRQGEPTDGLHLVLCGKVKICCRTSDGRQRVLDVRGAGDVLGTVSTLADTPRTTTAIAITDVSTALIGSRTLAGWIAEWPHVGEGLLRYMAERLGGANRHLLDLVFDDVPCRVAKQLLHLAERFGSRSDRGWTVRHDLTQSEIAQLVGATRESVNKAMCAFAHRGWIATDAKTTVILRPELLAKRAGRLAAAGHAPQHDPRRYERGYAVRPDARTTSALWLITPGAARTPATGSAAADRVSASPDSQAVQ